MAPRHALCRLAHWKLDMLDKLQPLANLSVRLWLGWQFWKSGVLKLPSGFLGIGQGDWSSTLFLFATDYKVPFMNPEVAAYLGTTFEILCPIMLLLGLGTRLAAVILLAMTALAEHAYPGTKDHIYWAVMCFILLTYGGSTLSLDKHIKWRFLRC